ncbi:hypothetical protein EP51_43380 (plasmid) [Rhodococcus opacus]|uniref:SsuA/THI5-like domain-containing protein n=1 Tax=Rhodococcus opacus TaxID=37919 RepID=A0A076F0L0_RHOOP|nr:hypothetical protein EP51_43380 [Rhodococcus opacus]
MGRFLTALTATVLSTSLLTSCSSSDSSNDTPDDLSGITLTFAVQSAEYAAFFEQADVFDDLPYTLETPVIVGPSPQLAALRSKASDVALIGDNTAAFEAANADEDWAETGPEVVTIGGASFTGSPYPVPALFVRTDSGINSIDDLRGKSFAYTQGGNSYAAYAKTLADAGLTPDDINPVLMPDTMAGAAAFVAGEVDAVIAAYWVVSQAVDSGEAKQLVGNEELGIPGGAGFLTRPDVLRDNKRLTALQDLFSRLGKFYSDWYPRHEAEVVKIYQDVLKVSPEVAQANFDNGKHGRLYRVGNPEFIAKEQALVDAAYSIGGVKHNRDISVVFNPILDEFSVPE